MAPNLIKKNENTTVQGLHSRILINLLFSCALKAYPPGNKGRTVYYSINKPYFSAVINSLEKYK